MLVLSRMKNESIVINDDITIVVVEIRGDKVRLGVEAPREVPVSRQEVYEAIRRSQQQRFVEAEARAAEPWRNSATAAVLEPKPIAVEERAPRDGFCCPQCQSDNVRIERVKPAYQGKELVRRRKCEACAHEFHTIERVEAL
jgi:carbon storage regulator